MSPKLENSRKFGVSVTLLLSNQLWCDTVCAHLGFYKVVDLQDSRPLEEP